MSAPSSPLQDVFKDLRNLEIKSTRQLIFDFWPCQLDRPLEEDAVSAISSYWKDQIRFEKATTHIVSSLGDLMTVALLINDNPAANKPDLITKVRSHLPGDDTRIANSIQLATRLFFMMDIRDRASSSPPHCFRTSLFWDDPAPLADVLLLGFPQTCVGPPQLTAPSNGNTSGTYSLTPRLNMYTKTMNIYNLERIGGFHIQWTDNLVEHLMFEDNKIHLFPHVSLLRRMKECINSNALPPSFFDETLDSLSLLLPRNNHQCAHWFEKQQSKHFLDPALLDLKPAVRDKTRYSFWAERLQILEEEFTDSEPKTLRQWWFDRRKRVQWYTFWVAILILFLTVVFGLTQTVAGIVQAWASVRSLKGTN
ncbi:hypothetical protein BJY04DRAFT_224091 [Aspergillus karnatakaensis]|uniref:uncharacterized protein n=1 Tax=Aspergillus karnatakaensis TaxID=1810916 RepID=UPI003CCD02D2